MVNDMKYALIGCGRIAERHINAAIRNNLTIVAICDLDVEKAKKLICKFSSIPTPLIYSNYKDLLDDNNDLEIVAIATPSGTHSEIALECINRKINVIIEKPIALSIKDANSIIEAGKSNNVCVSVCFQNRFNRALQQAKKAMKLNRLGKISHGSICVRWNRNEQYYSEGTWRGTWEQDGGCLMNQCIHGIDSLLWIIDEEVESVFGFIANRTHEYIDCEDVGLATIRFSNGIIATIEGTVNVYPNNLESKLSLFGEKGTIQVGGNHLNKVDLWLFENDECTDSETIMINDVSSTIYGNGHVDLYKDVINAINYGNTPVITAEDGKKALEVILAIYESYRTHSVVEIPLSDVKTVDYRGIIIK